jgi:hypothetical protein
VGTKIDVPAFAIITFFTIEYRTAANPLAGFELGNSAAQRFNHPGKFMT